MRILITGAAGTIGKVLMQCLSERHKVIGIDRKESKNVTTLDILKDQEKIKSLVNNGDVIIHLAWDVREGGTPFHPIPEENKQMAEVMFDIALERNAKRFPNRAYPSIPTIADAEILRALYESELFVKFSEVPPTSTEEMQKAFDSILGDMGGGLLCYFGYGAHRDPDLISALFGRLPDGKNAVLAGFSLCIQHLSHAPTNIVAEAENTRSPQELLKEFWPDDFRVYTIRRKPGSEAHGIVWLITPEERKLIREWQLMPYGWQHEIDTIVTLEDSSLLPVITEGVWPDQKVDAVVDGREYEMFLNGKESMIEKAHFVRRREAAKNPSH